MRQRNFRVYEKVGFAEGIRTCLHCIQPLFDILSSYLANHDYHVSMAAHGARYLTGMAQTLNSVLTIGLVASIEGTNHVGLALCRCWQPIKPLSAPAVSRMNKDDHWFSPDCEATRQAVNSGKITAIGRRYSFCHGLCS